jgi:hypothetical protein
VNLAAIFKFNQNHDDQGRFATGSGSGGKGGSTHRSFAAISADIIHDQFWADFHKTDVSARTGGAAVDHTAPLLSYNGTNYDAVNTPEKAIAHAEALIKILQADKNYDTPDKARLIAELEDTINYTEDNHTIDGAGRWNDPHDSVNRLPKG